MLPARVAATLAARLAAREALPILLYDRGGLRPRPSCSTVSVLPRRAGESRPRMFWPVAGRDTRAG